MNSITLKNLSNLKRRFILVIGIIVGISTMVLANPIEDMARLTKEEASELFLVLRKNWILRLMNQYWFLMNKACSKKSSLFKLSKYTMGTMSFF